MAQPHKLASKQAVRSISLCAYYDQDAALAGYADATGQFNEEFATGLPYGYTVEVWRYEAEADEIGLAFSHGPESTNGGLSYATLITAGEKTYIRVTEYPEGTNEATWDPALYYGLSGEEGTSFELLADASLEYSTDGGTFSYTRFSVDDVDYDDFALREAFFSEFTRDEANSAYGFEQSPEAVLATTAATLEALNEAIEK